ncbi:MAG: sulfotransferase, partial [Rhizomicrobium sp.]
MTAPSQVEKSPLMKQLELIDDQLRDGAPRKAKDLAMQLTEQNPESIDGWILLSRAYLSLRQFGKAVEAAERAISLNPQHPVAQLLHMDGLQYYGRHDEAFKAAKKLEAEKKYDPAILFQIADFYTRSNRHADAARCFERLRVLQPANRAIVYHLARANIALGESNKAEAFFNELLRKDPHEFDAYYHRSILRKQTIENNHVAELERIVAGMAPGSRGEPIVCYALGKELEDIGEWKRSFAYLKRGADARKRPISYSVDVDLKSMEEIARQFDESFFAEPHPGYAEETPIFVVGMPRSGTTLVDRIVSSHSTVGSVGESDEFCRTIERQISDYDAQGSVEIRQHRDLDFASVGRDYCRSINGLMPGYEHLLDKTPRNSIHLGMILTALPNAKIIHLRRHPVDLCYAMYKTLFGEGGFFSYDLNDIGRYYLAYLRLLDHWRRLLPGRFLDVDYEDVVNNQEEVSRRMIAFCGLDWEDSCLSFEKNKFPAMTASAVQVRQPIYKSSIALWRHYESELEPLIRLLK